jgi:hypothetical protein
MDTRIFREWPFWLVVGLYFFSAFLMIKIESWMTEKNTLYPALLFVIPVIATIYFFVLPTVRKK